VDVVRGRFIPVNFPLPPLSCFFRDEDRRSSEWWKLGLMPDMFFLPSYSPNEYDLGESSRFAALVARRAGYSIPFPAGLNMLRNATFSSVRERNFVLDLLMQVITQYVLAPESDTRFLVS